MRGLYACLLVWLMPTSSTQDKTTCRVRPVRLTEETSLTCYFPHDVSVSKKDFTVYHYLDGKQRVPVLDCLWLSGGLKCFIAGGYEYNRLVSSKVTVRIPSVTLNHTGKYSCQISGSNPEDLEFCRLFLTSGKTSCQVPEVEPAADTNLTCYFPEDISLSQRDFAVYRFKDQEPSELVVNCSWTGGESKCSTQPGYQVDPKISDHVTVNIRQASQQHIGTYLCGFLDDRPETSLSCSFQLKHLGNVLPERKAQESGHNTEATTAVIIVLAITTSVLILWVVLRQFLCRRLRCSQTTQESREEEYCIPRVKICRVLCSCAPPLTADDVIEGQHVQPVQRSRAGWKQDSALTCPTSLLAWSRRKRVPRNQDEEICKTAEPLLMYLPHKQFAPENSSNGDEIFPRTVRNDQTGEVGFSKPDLSSLKQVPAIAPQSLQGESVVTNEDTDEITKDNKGESEDISAKTKTMEERPQPENVFAIDEEKCSTVINTDTDQETGKQGAQSVGDTVPSRPQETQSWTPLNVKGENRSRDVKTETMDTLTESKLTMKPSHSDHSMEMLEKENEKDRKRPSLKKKTPTSVDGKKKNRKKGEEPISDMADYDSDEALNDQLDRQTKTKKSISLRSKRKRPTSVEDKTKPIEPINETEDYGSDEALNDQLGRQTKTKKSISLRSKSEDKDETTDVKDGDKRMSRLQKSQKN